MEKNVTYEVLAQRLGDALQEYRDACQDEKDAEKKLNTCRVNRSNALSILTKARETLFEAHPELQMPDAGIPGEAVPEVYYRGTVR